MILDQVLEINETGTDRQRNIKETKENKKLAGKDVSPADSSLGFRRNNLAQHIAKTLDECEGSEVADRCLSPAASFW